MSNLVDPQVLLALERTLLSWTRTSLALMAFGFLLERSTLIGEILRPELYNHKSFISKIFAVMIVLAGMIISIWSVYQYRMALKTLRQEEIIKGYSINLPIYLGVFNVLCGMMLLITFLL